AELGIRPAKPAVGAGLWLAYPGSPRLAFWQSVTSPLFHQVYNNGDHPNRRESNEDEEHHRLIWIGLPVSFKHAKMLSGMR
ncbi:MAG: hypothetical protein ACRD63_15160, partial [Pyrinomonadaceae bacterium]